MTVVDQTPSSVQDFAFRRHKRYEQSVMFIVKQVRIHEQYRSTYIPLELQKDETE
jgi:hypothetical protein